MEQDIFTIPEYCAKEKVSRSKVYSEWQSGGGVEFFKRGQRKLITNEARLKYRAQLEREAGEVRKSAAGVVTSAA
jgi:hypothetical protein